MGLQGTLETFSIPDVLRMLASTKKPGRLTISGDRGDGVVFLDGGEVVGASATNSIEGATPADVVFELLRFASGDFAFDDGEAPEAPSAGEGVDSVLEAAEALLAEWRELEGSVPPPDGWLTMVAELKGAKVVVTAAQWRAIAMIGGGTSAGRLAERLGLGELEAAKMLKDLLDTALVEVGEAVVPTPVSEPPVADVAPLPTWEEPEAVVDLTEPTVVEETTWEAPSLSVVEDEPALDEPILDDPVLDEPLVDEAPAPVPPLDEPPPAAASASAESFDPNALFREMGADSGADDGFLPPPPGGGLAGAPADEAPAELGAADAAEMARQLANLTPEAAKAVAAAAKATSADERRRHLDDVVALDGSINRDLLEKFLGTVG